MGSSSEKMKVGSVVSLTLVLGLLALADGGLLFGAGKKAGLLKAGFKTLFNQEKNEQHCEIKWEDVWKPHCTTTYEKICKQEPKQECSTEWREECWTEHEEKCETEWVKECHEPQEHHYSSHHGSSSSSHGHSEQAAAGPPAGIAVQNNVGTTK